MKIIHLVFIIILSISLVSATEISVTHQIFESKVLTEFDFPEGGSFNGQIPKDVDVIETELEYNLDPNKKLEISSSEPFRFLYITNTQIDKSSSKNFFTFQNPISQEADVKIFLPEGAFLVGEGDFIFPQNYALSTDGTRIIIEFTEFDDGEILIAYNNVESSNLQVYLILILLIMLGVSIYLVINSKRKRKKNENSTIEHLLNEREKKILDVLQEKSPLKQAHLSRLTEIPKASLSRHLQQLEKKKLLVRSGEGKNKLVSLK